MGVPVAMNDQIHAARDVSKSNTTNTDTFRTAELGVTAYIQGRKRYFYCEVIRKHTVDTEFDVSKLDALPLVDMAYAYANVGDVAVMHWWRPAPLFGRRLMCYKMNSRTMKNSFPRSSPSSGQPKFSCSRNWRMCRLFPPACRNSVASICRSIYL
jgi:hypothetical protein